MQDVSEFVKYLLYIENAGGASPAAPWEFDAASREPLGGSFEASSAPLRGRLGGLLGLLLGLFGAYWGILGAHRMFLGSLLAGSEVSLWRQARSVLSISASWGSLAALLGRIGLLLGRLGVPVGCIWALCRVVGAILG
eukprot:6484318-Pyramimonas_sp.AAC.1